MNRQEFCRKRDTVIRISDWTKDKHEPAFDVEIYKAGKYLERPFSRTFTTRSAQRTRKQAKFLAIQHIETILYSKEVL